jgi:hypothetical protein
MSALLRLDLPENLEWLPLGQDLTEMRLQGGYSAMDLPFLERHTQTFLR